MDRLELGRMPTKHNNQQIEFNVNLPRTLPLGYCAFAWLGLAWPHAASSGIGAQRSLISDKET